MPQAGPLERCAVTIGFGAAAQADHNPFSWQEAGTLGTPIHSATPVPPAVHSGRMTRSCNLAEDITINEE
jgi:hypothetical protein